MKKLLILLAIAMIPMLLVACGPTTTQATFGITSTVDSNNADISATNDTSITTTRVNGTNTDTVDTVDNSESATNDTNTVTKDTSISTTTSSTTQTTDGAGMN